MTLMCISLDSEKATRLVYVLMFSRILLTCTDKMRAGSNDR